MYLWTPESLVLLCTEVYNLLMKCLHCLQNTIPINRKKYCSVKCNQRAWVKRKYPEVRSFFNKDPKFWDTETGKGFLWEKYGANFLGAKHLEFNGSGADIDWNGVLVDVKACEAWKRRPNHNGVWVFNRNKVKKEVKFFLCICLKDLKPYRIFLIPSSKFPRTGITVGEKSKYAEFIIQTL